MLPPVGVLVGSAVGVAVGEQRHPSESAIHTVFPVESSPVPEVGCSTCRESVTQSVLPDCSLPPSLLDGATGTHTQRVLSWLVSRSCWIHTSTCAGVVVVGVGTAVCVGVTVGVLVLLSVGVAETDGVGVTVLMGVDGVRVIVGTVLVDVEGMAGGVCLWVTNWVYVLANTWPSAVNVWVASEIMAS